MNKALVICGPTGSGKSYLAHQLAKTCGGEIINCDSMQVYKEIPVLTASPSLPQKQEVPYHLYNFLNLNEDFSNIKYANLAANVIKEVTNKGGFPIIVGGTGMYINSLIYGYNEIPLIDPLIRQEAMELQQKIGQMEFFKKLITLDPLAAEKLKPLDSQRTLRAYEVITGAGNSIFKFQQVDKIKPLPEFNFQIIFLIPERRYLHQNCDFRLEKMFEEGAIEEVKAIRGNLLEARQSKKALGLEEIACYLNNQITLSEALDLAKARTRQYAKRQITWFKHQIKEKITLEYKNQDEFNQLVSKLPQIIK